jgi:hypothetical protein
MDDDEFCRGAIDIQWLERRLASLLERRAADDIVQVAAIAAALLAERDRSARTVSAPTAVAPASSSAEATAGSWKQAARLDALRD